MFTSAVEAIDSFYAKDIYDEEIEPIVIQTREGAPVAKIADGDAVIFFNFRADRARQLTRALTAQQFSEFKRTRRVRNLLVVTFTEYDALFTVAVAWPKEIITHPLAEVLAQAGMKQLHIAETEKYAHVTYFFNGGTEKRYDGEDHVLIPSKRDARYDTIPEMSASDIASRIIREVASKHYQFIVANFANADMVGHTANLKATMAAVETVDREVGRIAEVVLAEKGTLIITADHGNAEMLVNIETGQLQKEHTTNPVPCVIVNENFEGRNLGFPDPPGGDLSLVTPVGLLSDIAPTILKLFGLKKPKEMTGRSLI